MNILHLSDIHFGRNYPCYNISANFERHDEILEELIELIANMEEHLRPEHIVFTGDIVWQGKANEYKEALAWFRRLLSALHLTGKDISFCVGNHDVDVSSICNDPRITNHSVKGIDQYYKYENIHKLDFPLYGYNQFCRELGMEPYAYPVNGELHYSYSAGYKDVTFSNGKTVRLLAMNTALLYPFHNISSDKMWIGQEQLKSLIRHGILPASKDIWYTIALCHHSDRFLHPDETSSYDGRPATLQMLLEHVDLMLCGHTESSGKARLSKQKGGGNILCGGATYYSDDHINTFSVIILSDYKRTMGFLPYIYEHGWQDYDFEQVEDWKKYNTPLHPEKKYLENARILFQSGEDSFNIDLPYLMIQKEKDANGEQIKIHNNKDIMNPFRIHYDNRSLKNQSLCLTLSPNLKTSVKSHLIYRDFASFARNADSNSSCCRILTGDGEELLCLDSFTAKDECSFDTSFLQELNQLEDIFHVTFRLPESISDSDLHKINLLKQIARSGYAQIATLNTAITKTMNLEEMKAVYQTAVSDNHFYMRYTKGCSIDLFDVHLDLKELTVYAAAFSIDLIDIKYKLDTFCPGDLRLVRFLPDINAKIYLTHNQRFADQLNTEDQQTLAKIQDVENIDLNIMI